MVKEVNLVLSQIMMIQGLAGDQMIKRCKNVRVNKPVCADPGPEPGLGADLHSTKTAPFKGLIKGSKIYFFSIFLFSFSLYERASLSRDRPKIAPPHRPPCAAATGGLLVMKKTPKGRSGTPLSRSVFYFV